MVLRNKVLVRVSVLALLVGLSSAADAQSSVKTNALPEGQTPGAQAPDVAPKPTVNADGSLAIDGQDTVVVTGSRIRRRNLDTISPTITTDRQYLDERNITNVADAVNNLPGVRGSVSPNGAQGSFGQGVNFVNIGNLGSNRTLTLINGRRFVSSNPNTLFNQGSAGSQVDVNTVQAILLDHADIISIVGATLYGSDAIGGTVNYVLRDRYNGLLATGLSGISEQGDGFRYNAAFLAGHDFADGKLNITGAYTRDVQNGILYSDRDFLRAGLGTVTNPTTAQAAALGRTPLGITPLNDGRVNPNFGYNDTTTDGNPGTITVNDRVLYTLSTGGVITSRGAAQYNYQFDPSGNLVSLKKGVLFAAPYASGGDGYRLFPYSQVTSNLARDTGNLFIHYDAADALKFFFEGTYFHSRANQLVRQPTYNSSLFGGLSGPLTFTTANPFLTTQARTQLTALGINTFQISRASDDLADLSGYTKTDLFRGVLGARGDFKVGGRSFNYEIYGNYGRTLVNDFGQDINAQNFVNAVNVTTNAAGQIVCTATPAVQAAALGGAVTGPIADPNCVPLNLFGRGLSSAAARAYVIQNTHTRSLLQQKDFVANVGGSPFTMFANDVGFNIGVEHREESGSFTPDTFQQAGLGRSVGIAATSGNYKVNEAFGEVSVPIVTPTNGLSFLNRLELDGSARYVNNTINGGFFAYSGGGLISAIKDITFRGNYTKSFRGPAITELFLPRSQSFVTVPDLCSTGNINAGPAPATRAANCAAFLKAFPNATPLDAAAATVPAVSGGNPTLQNEVADSYTFGVIVQPRFIKRLSLTVDYVNIKIANPITNLSVTQIASACFDNPNFNAADPANGNAFCSQIKRYANGAGGTAANGGNRGGQVTADPANPGVSSGFVNGNRILYSSIQSTLDYNIPLEGLHIPGRFETNTVFYLLARRLIDTTGVAPLRTDGTFGDPKFQFISNNRIVLPGKGGISTAVNFTGRQIAVRTALSTDLREFNVLQPYATVDASIWADVGKQFRLTFSVTNIANKQYQNYYGTAIPASYIDLFGRRLAVSARAQF